MPDLPSIANMLAHLTKALAFTLLTATISAQTPANKQPTPTAALQRAQLIEKQEGDVAAAQEAYRALLADGTAQAVHDEAALHLGSLLWRLGQREEALPLLQRAVKAGGTLSIRAATVLQSDSLEAQESQARMQQAEALVGRMLQVLGDSANSPHHTQDKHTRLELAPLEKELKWLGDDAARVLVRHVGVPMDVAKSNKRLSKTFRPTLCSLLWTIGTEPARDFLLQVAKQSPLPFQRRVTSEAYLRATDMVPVLAQFAQTNDPTGEVWRNICTATAELPYESITQLVGHGNPATQAAGIYATARQWGGFSVEQRESFVANYTVTFEATLLSDSLRLQGPAWQLLEEMFKHGPTSATRIFLKHAHRYPNDARISVQGHGGRKDIQADDSWIAAAATLARRLGACTGFTQGSPRHALLDLIMRQNPIWTKHALPDLLDIMSLGYIERNAEPKWLLRCIEMASPAQTATIIRHLPKRGEIQRQLLTLWNATPDEAWFPAIRDVVEQCWQDSTIRWRGQRNNDDTMRWGQQLLRLIKLAARCPHPDLPAWLETAAHAQPGMAKTCIEALRDLSKNGSRTSRSFLRNLLAHEDNSRLTLSFVSRRQIFAELARAGDVESIPLLASTYGQGWSGQWTDMPGAMYRIDYVCDNRDSNGRPWHGFTDSDLAKVWLALLTSSSSDLVWKDLTNHRSSFLQIVPKPALPALAASLRVHWAGHKAPDVEHGSTQVLKSFGQVSLKELEATASLRSAMLDILTHPSSFVALTTYIHLTPEVRNEFVDEARASFRKNANLPDTLRRTLIAIGFFGREEWSTLFHSNAHGRYLAMSRMPQTMGPRFLAEIEQQLADDNATARSAACDAMARLYGIDAVDKLLPMLQDPDITVRNTARDHLNTLQTTQQQIAFWAQAKTGINVSPASAAAKLIAQALPTEDKEQRLLAIRSLMLLNAPESLPYLIDWTKDKDQDVQTAAKQAIAEMHRLGTTKK